MHEIKLYVYVSIYGSEALASFSIGAKGFKFGGLEMQGHTDGSSVIFLKVRELKREK